MTRKSNLSLGTSSFSLRAPVIASSAMILRWTDTFTAASASAAAAAAVAAVVVAVALVAVAVVVPVGKWKTTCRVLLSSLLVLPCSRFFLHHFSPSASSAELWVSSTLSSSRACSAALLAARQIRRRPRAVRMCGPPSTRIHHASRHHVMCLFDTSLSSVH